MAAGRSLEAEEWLVESVDGMVGNAYSAFTNVG